MSDTLDPVEDEVRDHAAASRLHGRVAVFVAVVATCMALCNVKDGNIVQAMLEAQSHEVDLWSYYQADSTKQHIAENTADTLRLQLEMNPGITSAVRADVVRRITEQDAQAQRYARDKEHIKRQAEQSRQEYDHLNFHDDQFDLAAACFSVGIALAGVTALTRKRWLFFVACAFAVIGVFYGLAGFLGWHLHSQVMARVLG